MATRTSNATLRTKTGCLTCRARRKKCTEEKPRCQKCTKSKRVCQWPNEDDMVDRRNRRASRSPSRGSESPAVFSDGGSTPLSQHEDSSTPETPSLSICRELSIRADLVNSKRFKSEFELACFHEFMKDMLPPLLLSHAHPGFHVEHLPEMVEMIVDFDGLRNIVLACGATRRVALSENSEMSAVELGFYSRAVTDVNHALAKVNWNSEDTDDAVLMAVCFLYIHGVFSVGKNKDIRKHLTGAIQLMKLRCSQSSRPLIARPIHRILWESILYQIFRQTVRHPFKKDFQPDFEFCDTAAQVLSSPTFPEASLRDNSPVIGFPIELCTFIIRVAQMSRRPCKPMPDELAGLLKEMEEWEMLIIDDTHCLNGDPLSHDISTIGGRRDLFHEHSMSLHILAVSLLLNWVTATQEISANATSGLPPISDTWQLRRALRILTCPHASKEWTKCYLGSWPSLIFGYAVDNPEDVELVRQDIRQRLGSLYCGDDLLSLYELEDVWRRRGINVIG